ncbi:MAG: hypothetical protein NDJ92_15040 [Thermoanaerobaculia bacterium]|nr:hypothetical protein [Thermoanaerobaculia bacterium]
MRRVRVAAFVSAVLVLSFAGCATNFSAPRVRSEIARQTGADPREVFEVYVGPVTMALVRHAVGAPADAGSSMEGSRVTSFEIGVYELAAKGSPAARALDLTLMPIRGWEPTLRYRTEGRSGMVLVRTSGDSIGDLVVLASDEEGVTYGRLRGTLSKGLPSALGKVLQDGGKDAIRHELESLSKEKK